MLLCVWLMPVDFRQNNPPPKFLDHHYISHRDEGRTSSLVAISRGFISDCNGYRIGPTAGLVAVYMVWASSSMAIIPTA